MKKANRSVRVGRVTAITGARRPLRRRGWSAWLIATGSISRPGGTGWSSRRYTGDRSIPVQSAFGGPRWRWILRQRLPALVVAVLAAATVTTVTTGMMTSTASAQPARVVAVPASIDATGATDVGEALTTFLATVPDNAVVVFPKAGRYRSERSLVFRQRHRLTLQGNGSTILATTREPKDRAQIHIINSTQLVFRDLRVQGPHPNGGLSEDAYQVDLETQHGFRLEAARDVQLDRVSVTDVFGDFVYIGRNEDRVPSQRIWIHDSTFARNGRQAIAITDASSVVIERNRFSDVRRAMFDLEPNAKSWKVRDIHILDNTIGSGRLLFVASHGAGPVDDVVISGNRLTDHGLTVEVMAPEGQRRSDWVVTDNTSEETIHSRALRFIGVDGVLISGNRQVVTGGEPAVVIWNTCGAQVLDNDFGSAAVDRKESDCDAELHRPTEPRLIGRGAAAASTTTTMPPPQPTSTTVGPQPSRPSVTWVAPVTTTTQPATAEPGGDGGPGVLIAVFVAGALLGAGAMARRRSARPKP